MTTSFPGFSLFCLREKPAATFKAEKRNEHVWTFLPRSPSRVWKNGGILNILLPKIKMFPLITWTEQAICLQKLQAVIITLSLLNFPEEYLIIKRTLTTLISLLCTRNVLSRCLHKMCSYKDVPGYMRSGAPLWTQKQHIFGQWFVQKN